MADSGVVVDARGRIHFTRDCSAFRFWFPLEHPIGLPDGYHQPMLAEPTSEETIHLSTAGFPPDARWLIGSVCCRQVHIARNWLTFRNADAALRAFEKSMPDSVERVGDEFDPAALGEEQIQVTVIEVATFGWDLEDSSDAFEEALDMLQRFERQIRLATKRPAPTTTSELLPSAIPSMAHAVDADPSDWDTSARLFFTNQNVAATVAPDMLDDSEIERLGEFGDRETPTLAASEPLDLLLEAQYELNERGNYRAAVLAAATAAESLLDQLLAALVWEEGKSPRQAASILGGEKFVKRMRRELPQRLGGTWDFDTAGPIQDWERDCHRLRHRVIHRGERPNEVQARAAVEAAHALTSFLTDRLIDKALDYPRVAGTWTDRTQISRRAAERIERLADTEPPWTAMFEGWYRCAISMARPDLGEPSLDEATPTVVLTAADPLEGYFVAVHQASGLAAIVEAPKIPSVVRNSLQEVALKQTGVLPIFAEIVGAAHLVQIGEWVPFYEIVPNTNPIHPTRAFLLREPPAPEPITAKE